MPPYKPMKRRDYEKWIGQYGWQLVKAGSGDWKLLDENGKTVKPFIKITHPGGEVIPSHVKATEALLKAGGCLP